MSLNLLFILLFFLNLLDVISTWIGLQNGLVESNPLMQNLTLEMIFFKILTPIFYMISAKVTLRTSKEEIAPKVIYPLTRLLNTYYLGVILWNVTLLLWT